MGGTRLRVAPCLAAGRDDGDRSGRALRDEAPGQDATSFGDGRQWRGQGTRVDRRGGHEPERDNLAVVERCRDLRPLISAYAPVSAFGIEDGLAVGARPETQRENSCETPPSWPTSARLLWWRQGAEKVCRATAQGAEILSDGISRSTVMLERFGYDRRSRDRRCAVHADHSAALPIGLSRVNIMFVHAPTHTGAGGTRDAISRASRRKARTRVAWHSDSGRGVSPVPRPRNSGWAADV